MNKKVGMWIAATVLVAVLLTATGIAVAGPREIEWSAASAPPMVSYQGKVMVGGSPFSGMGYFKFAVVDASGATSYWSNDGTSSSGGQPTSSVQLAVNNGLFTVLLGNITLGGMTRALDATVFSEDVRYLRVWFSSDNLTFMLLTPDQRVAAVPYALQAVEAENADALDGLQGSAYQLRVSGACSAGSTVQAVNADGTVVCSSPRTFYYPLLQAQSLDMAAINSNLKGFGGGFTDGRYGYFVPYQNLTSGEVARVDLQNFTTSGVSWLDLAVVDSSLKGFLGGFTDGRYGYFVPYFGGNSGKVARVDLQNFTAGGVMALDLTLVDSELRGFYGGFTDGRYGYFVPNYNSLGIYSGKAARVDLQNFSTGGVTVLDLAAVDSNLRGFAGGFTDGRYGYFVPSYFGSFSGKVARVDLQDFTTGGVTTLDLVLVDSDLRGFGGGFTDGRYGYFVPYGNETFFSGKIARVDLQNFAAGGVTALDLALVDSDLRGFIGGFTDGHYGYLVPFNHNGVFGKVARVDLLNFTAGGVTAIDLTAVDGALKGFYGGFTDGRYGYFVPNYNGSDYFGKVARIPLFFGGGAP